MSDAGNFLGTRDAGKRLGLSGQTVKNLIRQGELRAIHTSIGFVLRERDVDKYAKHRAKKAAQ